VPSTAFQSMIDKSCPTVAINLLSPDTVTTHAVAECPSS
jgi:hypothetical protein